MSKIILIVIREEICLTDVSNKVGVLPVLEIFVKDLMIKPGHKTRLYQ